MQAAPTRYLSVSELYSTDEVELLLEEIRELEPTSCRGEELQDFEIAGSGCGGGRSPVGTERSWDSHAQYRQAPPPTPRPLAPLYCHLAYLLTLRGALTLIVVVCGCASCACVWSCVGVRGGGTGTRALTLGALTSALLHAALLALHITRLARLLPLHWDHLAAWCGVWGAGAQICGGVLTVLAPHPPSAHALLIAAAGLGAAGACACLVLAGCAALACRRAAPPDAPAHPRASYRALPSAPHPCISNDDPL